SGRAFRRERVSAFLASSIQQIHSLRASGVMASQAVRTVSSSRTAMPRSSGSSCTVPAGRADDSMEISLRLPYLAGKLFEEGYEAARHFAALELFNPVWYFVKGDRGHGWNHITRSEELIEIGRAHV